MEIERKFLVKHLPDNLAQYAFWDIEQGYLSVNPTLRIRMFNNEYVLTVKSPRPVASSVAHKPIVNIEEEFPLSESAYLHLRAKCDSFVTKRRYRIPLDALHAGCGYKGLTAELDVFTGCNEGLLLVEVEFPNVEAAHTFVPPEWFGEDVSMVPEYRNAALAK